MVVRQKNARECSFHHGHPCPNGVGAGQVNDVGVGAGQVNDVGIIG